MNSSESFEALRRANPRSRAGFPEAVGAAGEAVRMRLASASTPLQKARPHRRRRAVGVSVLGLSAAAVAAAVFLTVSSPGGGPGVENASAAVKKAASVTADAAKESGTATLRMTHGDEVWAASTVRWSGADIEVVQNTPDRAGKIGGRTLVVDGMLYGLDPEGGGWVEAGPQSSIDPDSGTTPAETLTAVREDVGGVTLQRITGGMADLATTQLSDGSIAYSGTVASGLIARESGFKDGEAIRVLPLGYVANGVAADPAAPLDTVITVGADGVVRKIAVGWGRGGSAWTYAIDYSKLGATAALKAPENAKPLDRKVHGS